MVDVMVQKNSNLSLIEFLKPDNNQSGALYVQLARSLTQAIHEGMLQDGDYLLPQRELAEALGISRVTVRKAIESLVDQGLLTQRQGSGTIVNASENKSIHKNLAVLNSFTEDMNSRGMNPSSRWVSRDLVMASPKEAMALNLSPGDRVCRFTRIRSAGDMPMAFETASIPASLIQDPYEVDESLYESLDQKNARPHRALQSITAQNCDNQIAEYLRIAPGDAVLYIERQGFDLQEKPVEFTRSYYRGDVYDFVTELKTNH